jgi:hypothetical protein
VSVPARAAAILFLVLTAGAPLFAAENDAGAWFRSDPQAAAYAVVEPDISAVFTDADQAGIPTALLMDKLKEGASKTVAPDRLLLALRAEASRLTAGQAAVTRAKIRLAGTDERANVLKAISLLLVSGVQDATVDSLLAASSGKRNPSDLVDALNVLVQIRLSTGLTDGAVQVLGTALLKSGLPRGAFPALPGVLFNAAARGMEDETAAAVLADVLNAGGGILQMENALQKKADTDAAAAGVQGAAGSQGTHGRPATAPTTPASTRSGGTGNGGNPPGQSGSQGKTDHNKGS